MTTTNQRVEEIREQVAKVTDSHAEAVERMILKAVSPMSDAQHERAKERYSFFRESVAHVHYLLAEVESLSTNLDKQTAEVVRTVTQTADCVAECSRLAALLAERDAEIELLKRGWIIEDAMRATIDHLTARLAELESKQQG